MERYMPPFTITNQMLMLVAEIAEKTGNISNFHSFETKPHLRRNNRIRSIHSSLAIEANSLSLDEVEKEMIRKALEKHHGKRKSAAKDLNISERTLYRKIKEYGLD